MPQVTLRCVPSFVTAREPVSTGMAGGVPESIRLAPGCRSGCPPRAAFGLLPPVYRLLPTVHYPPSTVRRPLPPGSRRERS